MTRCSSHPNVIKFIGAWMHVVVVNDPVCARRLYGAGAHLHRHRTATVQCVRRRYRTEGTAYHRTAAAHLLPGRTYSISVSHSRRCVSVSQSACGVAHLHKEGVIHRDIAARNFLLDWRNNVSVCDFGLARIKTGAYQHTKSSLGPVRCMAPESISKKRYSEASDAWSFGVYLWEITHVKPPFANIELYDVMTGVVGGSLRLTIEPAVATTFGR
jgi:serine/threonine protein kinase